MSEIVSQPMTREEAEGTVEKIRSHLHRARQLLLDLYEREGWRALGYDTFANCIEAEFTKSRSYVYREIAAAQLESGLDREIGEMPESHARVVIGILGDDEQGKREAVALAETQPHPTAQDYTRASLETWVRRNVPHYYVCDRMDTGELSPRAAYEIGQIILEEKNNVEGKLVIENVSDPQLARDLIILQSEYPSMWHELLGTGSIPYGGESVPLKDATYTMLRAWVTIDNAEARARYVEENRAFYDGRNELADTIIDMTEELCWHIHNGGDNKSILALSDKVASLIHELRDITDNRKEK